MNKIKERFIPFCVAYTLALLCTGAVNYLSGGTMTDTSVIWGAALLNAFIQAVDVLLEAADFKWRWMFYLLEYVLILAITLLAGRYLFGWFLFTLRETAMIAAEILLIYVLVMFYFSRRNRGEAAAINEKLQGKAP